MLFMASFRPCTRFIEAALEHVLSRPTGFARFLAALALVPIVMLLVG